MPSGAQVWILLLMNFCLGTVKSPSANSWWTGLFPQKISAFSYLQFGNHKQCWTAKSHGRDWAAVCGPSEAAKVRDDLLWAGRWALWSETVMFRWAVGDIRGRRPYVTWSWIHQFGGDALLEHVECQQWNICFTNSVLLRRRVDYDGVGSGKFRPSKHLIH